jgi:DNA-binding transcriptional MerR regulator
MKLKNNLTISQLAKKAGVNLQTIRYYESLNLLPEPERTGAGYRLYHEDYVRHIKFVKNSQHLGFSLDQIRDLVTVKYDRSSLGKDVKKIIKSKIQDIESQINELEESKQYLQELYDSCSGRMQSSCCPILNALENE